CRYICLTFI
ncbi:hypothetical protein V3C99_001679, partial [Haemonchus contortus]